MFIKRGENLLKERLCTAYSLLYDIELTLKSTISEYMCMHYGQFWRTKLRESINLQKCYFYELVTIIFRYPKVFLQFQSNRDKFHLLINIRNKICHMQALADDEFLVLTECHKAILPVNISSISITKSGLNL